MPVRSRCTVVVVAALAGLLCAPTAHAARPENDAPSRAGVFAPYAAAAGKPVGLSAVGELVEARPDRGVPRCLGKRSFARTVWYRIPAIGATQLLSVEAVGRTLALVDLAAYVQPDATSTTVREPNVCDGFGGGGSDATIEPTSSVSLIVPPNHAVLLQVGRRGPVGVPDNERVFLSLNTFASEFLGAPPGDEAGDAPRLRPGRAFLSLSGATITGEDPAEPACPSLGTVWRKVVPEETGRKLITVSGEAATTLTVYRGKRPTGKNAVDCVVREERRGALKMNVPVQRRKPLWVKVGTERTTGDEEAAIELEDGNGARVVDGGPGGFDPTRGGPGGGLPASCDVAAAEDAVVTGSLSGSAGNFNRLRRIPLRVTVENAALCELDVVLRGPGGGEYAGGSVAAAATGERTLTVPRRRTFRPGRYRLRIRARSSSGKTVAVKTRVTGRLS